MSAKEQVELSCNGAEGGNAVSVLADRNAKYNSLANRIMLSSFKCHCSLVPVMHLSLTDRKAKLQQCNQDLLVVVPTCRCPCLCLAALMLKSVDLTRWGRLDSPLMVSCGFSEQSKRSANVS